MSKPLDGIRVLDFSHALAGPYCTMLLAAYGAEVYKVEGIDSVDMGRIWGPPFQGGEASYFLGLNSGKHSLSIDLKRPEGLALCHRLLEKSDVFIENLRPGAMSRLGLGWEKARQINPRLVYCSISGYGQNGPSRDEAAMDLILQASCGLISVTGTPDGRVARCGHSVADITSGMFALIGILMALRVREQTGAGQFVDIAMLDSMISAMASNFANYFGTGVDPKPMGTAFTTIVPYATYPTRDREVAIAAASEKLWQGFCDAVGHTEWADDPRFAANHLRVANRGVLEPMIVETLQAHAADVWVEVFRKHGVPCTPVRTLAEVANDAQAAARNMFPTLAHTEAGEIRVTGVPIKFSETPGNVEFAAPTLGRHTRESLRTLLGVSDAELDTMTAAGIIK
ncbi:MAG: CoA transferase [Candidatus Solibacter usitatus]|nr:CoA transferase [Candidatus Solibacter usitatus]